MHLHFTSDKLTPDQVDMIAHDLCLDLSDTGEVRAEAESRALEAGERGVATVIGGIVVELLKTSAVTKLIEVLGSYLSQEPSMVAKMDLGNGVVVELNSKSVRSEDFAATLAQLVAQQRTA